MASRMERYTSKKTDALASRALKNRRMYEDLYTNATYTTFSSIEPSVNVIDLSDVPVKNTSRREAYQKTRGAVTFGKEEEREIRDYESIYPKAESVETERNFDINQILEEAKKNREDEDELERKRKLKTTEYNILAELNEEKMKEYQKNKDVLSKEEEKNLEELIHTITSKTMAHDVNEILEREKKERKNKESDNGSLLDDLMPTKLDETIVRGEILEEIKDPVNISINAEDLKSIEALRNSEESGEFEKLENSQTILDKSFYTRSMDLSKEDLMGEEESLYREDKRSAIGRIFFTLLILCLIAGIVFVVWQYLLK